MLIFLSVLLLSALSVAFEGLIYHGILGQSIGAVLTYLRVFLIFALLISGYRKIAAIVYLTFLGSSLTEVNFLQDQGFITSSAFLDFPGFQAVRVPGLPFGWSTFLGLVILIAGFFLHKRDDLFRAKLRVFLLFMAFGAAALAFSVLSYFGGTFSGDVFSKDLNRFLISIFSLGLLFFSFPMKEVKATILGITVGTLLSTAVLSNLGITRLYAGSWVALSQPAHAYIFLIALLVPGIGRLVRTLMFLLVIGLAVASDFLVSGKTIISLILLLVLASAYIFGRRYSLRTNLGFLVIILALVIVVDFKVIGSFFIEQGYELAGYKISQLALLSNFSNLGAVIFFNSSGGNIVAETLSIGAMLLGQIPEHLPLVGLGFGGQIVDYFHILGLANADAYPAEAFQSGLFSGMHLALLGYLFWGGIVGFIFVWTITVRYILPSKDVWLTWALIMSFLIYGLADKFDATLFVLLLSAVLAERPNLQPIRRLAAA